MKFSSKVSTPSYISNSMNTDEVWVSLEGKENMQKNS